MALGWFRKGTEKPTIPTVSFDSSRVSDAVKADLWDRIREFEDLPLGKEKAIYSSALSSIQRGRDLAHLTKALVDMDVPKGRAAFVALYLHNRATAIMAAERAQSSGLTEAKWLYSGAPCYAQHPASAEDTARDSGHKAANGKRFPLARGLEINGALMFPGMEPGCKCVMTPIVPGFD